MHMISNLGWAGLVVLLGGGLGVVLVMGASLLVPKIIERLTPSLDEEKEIARGNRAVAEYFGRLVAATIIGVSIVIAAAVIAGILATLLPVDFSGR